jgi:hypothetical protein|tara:strand:+ start:2309 stop:2527 length:219 start_codon:yes stop_codon:yes gene_type:complete
MGGVARKILPKPPAPPAPVYTPAPTKAEVSQVSSTDATGIMRGKGRSSTILTGAKGLGDNALTTTKKSLLGG